MQGVLIANPDVFTVKITEDMDFLVLGCDGIFDQLSNKEVVESVWMSTKEKGSFNQHCCMAVDMIMKSSLVRKTLDNVTVVFLAFENFEKAVTKHQIMNHNEIEMTEKSNKENLEIVNSAIQRSFSKKLILQEKKIEKNQKQNLNEKKEKGDLEENLTLNPKNSDGEKIHYSMNNFRIVSSKNIFKNMEQNISKIYNIPKKLHLVEKKIFYYNRNENKGNIKLNNYQFDKIELSEEIYKMSKHLTNDRIPTANGRNINTQSDIFHSRSQNRFKSKNEKMKNRNSNYEISKMIQHNDRLIK